MKYYLTEAGRELLNEKGKRVMSPGQAARASVAAGDDEDTVLRKRRQQELEAERAVREHPRVGSLPSMSDRAARVRRAIARRGGAFSQAYWAAKNPPPPREK